MKDIVDVNIQAPLFTTDEYGRTLIENKALLEYVSGAGELSSNMLIDKSCNNGCSNGGC